MVVAVEGEGEVSSSFFDYCSNLTALLKGMNFTAVFMLGAKYTY